MRSEDVCNSGLKVKCSQKYCTLQRIDINIVQLQQLNSAVLPLVDARIWLASVFRGGKPDKPHLRSCDFYIVPTAKQHTFTKTSRSLISILAAKPDGV